MIATWHRTTTPWAGALALVCLAGAAPAAQSAEPTLSLTVYNQDFALVKDVRTLDLERGAQVVRIDDVASAIEPTSVHFAALDHPGAVQVTEQNYQYDLAGAERLLQRYLNHSLSAVLEDGTVQTGTLLSYDGSWLVLQGDGGVSLVARDQLRNVEMGSLPGGLVVRPTLVWNVRSERAGSERAEISYLTNQIGWHAEYVAVVNASDTRLGLDGWVSLDNRSGASYENAKLKLVAGDVRRVRQPQPYPVAEDAMRSLKAAAPQFEERGFFEYHIYVLDTPATVADRETKQLALFPSAGAGVKKILTYDATQDPTKVAVQLEFENSRANGLGMALPAGTVRVYKEDADGALEFAGEDHIDHTPRDETVRLTVGNAFDVVGERTRTNFEKIGTRAQEETFTVQVRNHKDERVRVTVVEHLFGDWKILSAEPDYTKKDSNTVEFPLDIPADGDVTVTYTVRTTW